MTVSATDLCLLQFMENNRHHFKQADPQLALAAIREQGTTARLNVCSSVCGPACQQPTLQQLAEASVALVVAVLGSDYRVLEGAGLGSLRQELESRMSGATEGDVTGDGTIDFDAFDAALQATRHSILRHQVQRKHGH